MLVALSRRLTTFALVVLGAAVPACGGSPSPTPQAGSAPSLTLSACTIGGTLSARCGTLSVAENPADTQGRRIALRVVVLPARGVAHATDPLLYFAGYGGAGASDDAQWVAATFWRLNLTRDIVLFDQRGTGASNRMECPAFGTSDTGALSTEAIAAMADACLESVARSGDPRFYTTPIAVDDADRVRAALGYDKVDVYGASYGVSAGLAYIQRHGEHVRAAVFDSGSLLDVRLWELGGRSAQQALDGVVARCDADRACHAAYPGLASELTAVLNRLASAPPAVQVTDPQTSAPTRVVVTVQTFLGVIGDGYLTTAQSAAGLPRFIHRAYRGDWNSLVEEYAASRPQGGDPRVTLVSSNTIACSDEWARIDGDSARRLAGGSAFTATVAEQARIRGAICARWPVATGVGGTVSTEAPVVFLNGTADPADPPSNVAAAPKTMPHSLVVPVVGYGHGQLSQDPSGVLVAETTAFIEAGRPSTLADWPVAQNPWCPPFVVP